MPYLKKIIFALPFLLFFFLFCLNLDLFLQNSNFLFSLDLKIILQAVLLVSYLLLSSLFFAILVTFSMNWKIVIPTAVLASLIPLFLITSSVYILIAGFFLTFLIVFFTLQKKLQNYLTFQASILLIPSIKRLSTFIILVSSLVFYFNISQSLVKNGFQIPDSLLDPIINLATSGLPTSNLPQGPGPMMNISADQINLLKQNPDLLKQYGFDPRSLGEVGTDPKILDQITTTQSPVTSQNSFIKQAISAQINNLIGPNIGIVAIILSITFFVSLNFLSSFLSLLIYPIISGIFWILEKTGFTKFEVTQREVKKLIV
ncbi:MAG: hypothetical protein Q7R97_02170 [Candidatus Daviesbacteria bacterium]|nr:hypothetical protein [Candidatus Daviesbacteria bacterium]